MPMLCSALRDVREFLTPERWQQGCTARDNSGLAVSPADPTATRFCVQGAILHRFPSMTTSMFRQLMQLLHAAAREVSGDPRSDLFKVNDAPETDYTTIIAVLDHAIAEAEQLTLSANANSILAAAAGPNAGES